MSDQTQIAAHEDASALTGKRLLIVGGASGIALRLAIDAARAGCQVVLAGRSSDKIRHALAEAPLAQRDAIEVARVDLRYEAAIRELAAQVGDIDHLVSLAAAHATGHVTELDADAVRAAFDAKVIGPILLAKHLSRRIRAGGSILLFSGVAAWRPAPGLAVTAATNGAVSFLAEALAVELGPIRVNALSPGVVDSGYWDSLGEGKAQFLADTAERNPARRVGDPADIAAVALSALTSPYVTGTTFHVDGGARLV